MLNKLDNKLILDRQFALELLDCLDVNDPDHGQVAKKLHEIMSVQDNTGCVATVAKPTREMAYAGRNARLNTRIPPIMDSSVGDTISFRTMLNASPPLLGGGE
jgi:hypothetical protein